MKKNNNKTLIFTILVVILAMIALIATSGTYAKYTSSIGTTQSSATVAKWLVKVNDQDITTGNSNQINFDLFETIYEENGSEAETDVSPNKIAPGTSGSFTFTIKNESEVKIAYDIALAVENPKNIPIKYSLTEDAENYVDFSTLNTTLKSENAIDINNDKPVTIYWKWAFAGDDTVDTQLGKDATDTTNVPTYNVSATISATQIN